jgi:hypothetical protein
MFSRERLTIGNSLGGASNALGWAIVSQKPVASKGVLPMFKLFLGKYCFALTPALSLFVIFQVACATFTLSERFRGDLIGSP